MHQKTKKAAKRLPFSFFTDTRHRKGLEPVEEGPPKSRRLFGEEETQRRKGRFSGVWSPVFLLKNDCLFLKLSSLFLLGRQRLTTELLEYQQIFDTVRIRLLLDL